MRQIYSSQRLENVDKVEAMMQEVGIETYVSGRDKLRRDRRRRFSYTDRGQQGEWPAVWVVNADDLPKARDIMREAGLMGSTRPEYSPAAMPARVETPESWASRIRRGLLVLVVVTAVMMGMWMAITTPERNRPPPRPAPVAPVVAPVAEPAPVEEPKPETGPNVIVIEDLGDGS